MGGAGGGEAEIKSDRYIEREEKREIKESNKRRRKKREKQNKEEIRVHFCCLWLTSCLWTGSISPNSPGVLSRQTIVTNASLGLDQQATLLGPK